MPADKPETDSADPGWKPVGATVATLAVIRHACAAPGAFRLADTARATDLNRSTAFNILRTLAQQGVLSFDAEAKAYALTDYLPRLVRGMDDPPPRIEVLHQGMASIARLYGIAVGHWTIRGDSMVLAAAFEGGAEWKLAASEGRTMPLLYGAAGRAIAAAQSLPDTELQRLIALSGDGRPDALARIKDDLERARARGWADDGGSLQPGVKAVAVCIRDGMGQVEGACAALMLNGQFSDDDETTIALALRRIAGGA